MISKDKQYSTRSGREVRIYATDGGKAQPVHGAVREQDGTWEPVTWRSDGRFFPNGEATLDLIEVRPRFRLERWANVHRSEDGEIIVSNLSYKTKDEALRMDRFNVCRRLATKRIIIEGTEGEDDPE